MKFNQKILPHLVAVLVFFTVTVVFYSPLIIGGKVINQHDMLRGLGASQEIIDFRESTGEEALWTNSMFGGMPAFLINTHWSGDLLLYVHKAFSLWLPGAAGATLIACLSFYIMLLAFGVRPWLAIVGGLSYGLGSFNIISIEAGHMWKVWAIAYMPLVLGGVHLTVKGKHIPGLLLTALGLALELRSNHLQITYYLLLLLLIYGATYLVYAIRNGQIKSLTKSVGLLIIAALLALGCNLGKIWSVYEYGQYSTRGASDLTSTQGASKGLDRDYAFRWSNGILEPITLLIPDFFGGPTVASLPVNSEVGEALRANGLAPVQIRQQLQQVYTYWGTQPITAGPSYAGAIVIFLFVLGYFLLDRKDLIWLTIAVVVSIALSWGHNFESLNNFMFDYFPGYNKFRSVSMTLVIALLCIPLTAFIALEKLVQDFEKPDTRRKVFRAATITGGILVLAIAYSAVGDFRAPVDEQLSGQLPPWYFEALRADRAALLRGDAIRSFVLISMFLAGCYFYSRRKINSGLLFGIIGVLVLFDLWTVDKRYLNSDDFTRNNQGGAITLSAADQKILGDPDINYRVLSYLQNPWAESGTFNFHKSIGGYHGAKIRRYQELIEGCLDNQYRGLLQSLQAGEQEWGKYGVINMLNTRYLIVGPDENSVIGNPSALGNAWLVSSVQNAVNADDELAKICQFDPSSTAVIDQSRFKVSDNSFNNSGEVVLEEYKPNYLKYRFENPGKALAVFSEIYYPNGWTATIDGTPVDVLRANFVLRALEVPGGSHTIEFKFQPASYHTGNKIMMGSSILLLLMLTGAFYYEFKSRKISQEQSEE